jgi:hypothetical protein
MLARLEQQQPQTFAQMCNRDISKYLGMRIEPKTNAFIQGSRLEGVTHAVHHWQPALQRNQKQEVFSGRHFVNQFRRSVTIRIQKKESALSSGAS